MTVKSAAGENIVHYLCRYEKLRSLYGIPVEYLEILFGEQYVISFTIIGNIAIIIMLQSYSGIIRVFLHSNGSQCALSEMIPHSLTKVRFFFVEIIAYLIVIYYSFCTRFQKSHSSRPKNSKLQSSA